MAPRQEAFRTVNAPNDNGLRWLVILYGLIVALLAIKFISDGYGGALSGMLLLLVRLLLLAGPIIATIGRITLAWPFWCVLGSIAIAWVGLTLLESL